VVFLVAVLAGAALRDAGLAAVSMTMLQFAIGATNDLVDAPRDAGRKPGKPIPRGHVSEGTARIVAVVAAGSGLVLAYAAGGPLVSVGVVVLAIGLAYDLRFKGTALSWLPFAVGIPLLPIYGWLAARGGIAPLFGLIVPVAFLEGAALAVANAFVDLERDRAAGISSVATALGRRRSWLVGASLQLAVAVVATGSAVLLGASAWSVAATLLAGVVIVGGAYGALAGAPAADARSVRRRETAWRIQALAAGGLAVAWVWGVLQAGRL